jgi:hypothetical protein
MLYALLITCLGLQWPWTVQMWVSFAFAAWITKEALRPHPFMTIEDPLRPP